MNFKNVKTTVKKELKSLFRDKKTFRTICLYVFLVPAMIFLLGSIYQSEENMDVSVGIDYDLNEMETQIINDFGLNVVKYNTKEELDNAYNNGEIGLYILKDGNVYTMYYDVTVIKNAGAISAAGQYLETYNNMLAQNYLIEKGVDIDKAFGQITIEESSLSEEDDTSLLTIILKMIPSYIIMVVSVIGMSFVAELIAGEKEKGTLETLLTFPISSQELVFGKYLSLSLISTIGGLLTLVFSLISLKYVSTSFSVFSGSTLNLSIGSVLIEILIIIISSFTISGILMALCGKAKSFKEAQSKVSIVSFITMVPMIIQTMGTKTTLLYSLIPIVNCEFLITDVIIGSVDTLYLLLMIGSTIVYIVAIIYYLSKQYGDEKTLFQ